jgi:protease-4
LGLNEIINAIENARNDSKILGISIQATGLGTGLSKMQSIRKKLEEFKSSGKFVQAYADVYDQKAYYLSSVADSVYLNPEGGVDFRGLSSEVLFFKDFEDQTGIRMEVVRHGRYKSAVEPFIASEMSDENREQITTFLNALWDSMKEEMAESRKLSVETLDYIADNTLGRNATLSMENDLIDGVLYPDMYRDNLAEMAGIDPDSLKEISIGNYIAAGKGRSRSTGTDRIAVLYAQGDIIYGHGNEDFIGQELLINALKKIRRSSSIKGLVLRVDSPGGTAIAS